MSCTSEVGISPVLLQAISHTLTSTENQETVDKNSTFDRRHETNGFCIEDSKEAKEATSAILKFASDQESETKIVPILHGMHEPTAPLIRQVQMDGNGLTEQVILDASPEVKAMLKQKINQRVIFKPHSDAVNISDANMSFVNVYTTIENADIKSRDLSGLNNEIKIIDGRKYAGSPDVIVCYNHDSTLVPSPANDIIVSDSENGMVQSSSPLKPPSSELNSASPQLKFNHQLGVGDEEEEEEDDEDEMGTDSNSNSQVIDNKETIQKIYISQSEESMSFPVHNVSTEVAPKDGVKTCPVCEDKVSGYHYGIFSCESCKGFFKRTVQNIKAYKCHQKGNCEINVYNRKKCPACRFTKCIDVGMKLEAIRVDRTRGGRSSYDGCSPHGRARERHTDKRKFQKLNISKLGASQPTQQQQQHSVVTIPGVPLEAADQNKASQLVAILSRKSNSMGNIFSEDKKPFVPQLLTDIMNLESFLCDDELSIDILPKDPSSYTSLMQITEVRLYKIVRWARNLAQFTSISTDDQILLLQNCWSDLLLLECCYRSKEKPTEIRLAQGNTISVEVANSLGMGSVVSMVVELAEQLNRLKVDLYEFVGLKVLVLITPDVKGLKNPEKTRKHQEKLCEALDMYTSSHYPQHPNKFGEMILTLPTLSRISIKGKELITDSQLKNISSYGLLYELLKGENAIKDPSGTSSA